MGDKRTRVGITIGDINGVGVEVILKTLADERILKHCTPVIYGSSKTISYHKNILSDELTFDFNNIKAVNQVKDDRINVVNCWNDNVNIALGKAEEAGGKYAKIALEQAVVDLQHGSIDALVTAPINKKAMNMAGFKFPGHTEFLTESLKAKGNLMLMVNDDLRVGLVTNHLPLKEVAKNISKKGIIDKLELMSDTLKTDFGIEKPLIAVLGLNPHASDEGVLGDEEEKIIRPAIIESKKKGVLCMGPYAADGFFGAGTFSKFDGILAMYHDQGLVPFKALSFGNGVNYTGGLPHIRTSPDHGTAYDIAGKNEADPASFRQALYLAIDTFKNRSEYFELREDVIERYQPLPDEENQPEET